MPNKTINFGEKLEFYRPNDKFIKVDQLAEEKDMFIIVDIKGEQFKVVKGDSINVPLIDKKENELIKFNNVLLISKDNEELIVGKPYIKEAVVEARVLGVGKGKKLVSYKYKRRKGYHRKIGHRQKYLKLKIESIEYNGEKLA